jgi:hypothetical protein
MLLASSNTLGRQRIELETQTQPNQDERVEENNETSPALAPAVTEKLGSR